MAASRPLKVAVGIVIAVALGGVAWLSGRSAPRMSVVLVTLDTVRADAIGAFGAPAGRTPNLDGFAQEAIVFDRAYTTAPLTLPAHASIFTGLYPRSNGVRRNVDFRLPDHADTIATAVHASGYRTAAFVSSIVLGRAFGLDAGFDVYDEVTRGTERRAPETAARAIEWLHAGPPEPFFLWVHFYDAHAPYEPPPAFRDRFSDPYAGEVALVDQEIGHILEALDAEGFGDRTVAVVAADHGEDRMQHGEPEHGVFLYDSAIHVPVLIRVPGRRDAGRRDASVASLVDLCPTLLELVDVSFPHVLQGRALLLRSSTARPKDSDHGVLAETTFAASVYGWSPLDAFVRGPWKLIEGPKPELYDLSQDPGETRDLSSIDVRRLQEMRARFAKAHDALHPLIADASFRPSAAERAALESLGYVAGRSDDAKAPSAAGAAPDPKSVIGVLPLLSAGRAALRAGKATEAIAPLRQAARIDSKNARVLDALGAAYHSAGQYEEARAALESALASDPSSPEILTNLGATHDALGDKTFAENAYRRAIALDATSTAPQMDLLLLLFETGRYRDALAQADAVHRLRPELPLPRLLSGRCREALGDLSGARADYARSVALSEARDDSPDSLLVGAEAAFRGGNAERGEALAQKVLERFPSAEAQVRERLGAWRTH